MGEFLDADLHGSTFRSVDLSGAEFSTVDFSRTTFRDVYFSSVKVSGAQFTDVEISGDIENVSINGVDVGPLVQAALDERYPLRSKMRPSTPAGFIKAWDIVESLWAETVRRAEQLPREYLHESVDGEWSFIDTLRHLTFATDSWVRRAILGDPTPWDPLGLPWAEAPPTPGVPHDTTARPSLEVVLQIRRDRMASVRRFIDSLTDESLEAFTTPVEGPGWPESESYAVRRCLLTVLNEEWEHRLFAERDLAILEDTNENASSRDSGAGG